MKANELMIGDWVKSRGKIEQVTSVYDGFICTDSFEDSHDYYFDPIPLTPEILEKNGFVYKELKGVGDKEIWRIEDDYYDIDIYEWSDSIWIFRYDCTEMSLPHTQVTMSYVHELQHALRLCGIEKDIVL